LNKYSSHIAPQKTSVVARPRGSDPEPNGTSPGLTSGDSPTERDQNVCFAVAVSREPKALSRVLFGAFFIARPGIFFGRPDPTPNHAAPIPCAAGCSLDTGHHSRLNCFAAARASPRHGKLNDDNAIGLGALIPPRSIRVSDGFHALVR
jgi:hypothetical protein